ncbi:MAG: F0F1 ATP synthase subunit A [Clostridia bacterium]|nr:F0F1 ATP synthase subunit A [Clostridia bacterium]
MKKKRIIIWLAVLLSLAAVVALLSVLAINFAPEPKESTEPKPLIEVGGSRIILGIPMLQAISEGIPLLELGNVITQTTVSILVTTLLVIAIAIIVTRRIDKRPGKLQVVVEKLMDMLYGLVRDTMGEHNLRFAPYIGTLFMTSFFSTVLGMTQIFRSASGDLSVTLAWALVTTGLVWYSNIKNFGFVFWLKGFTEPVVVMTPMNIVSEIASPISMAFRHFGNVAGGGVLTSLIYGALAGMSQMLFNFYLPIFQMGIPAILSIYFDLFSGFVQAFVFCLLTMVYVGGACPPEEEILAAKAEKEEKRAAKRAARAAKSSQGTKQVG